MGSLFIPKRIKVGFQKRQDTYNGMLAYVIYFDSAGKLRKEQSWEGWRDKSIPALEFDNVPTSGFIINKDIKRYSGDWFDSKRTLVRIHDPRDWEFEITTGNLITVLMHTDCLKRGLQGDFVYAWDGKELVLLPTCSKEYQDAQEFTKLSSKKVSVKDLTPGFVYIDKHKKEKVYLGRFDYYIPNESCAKKFVFGEISQRYIRGKVEDYWRIFATDCVNKISECVSAAESPEYGKLLKLFNDSQNNKSIISHELVSIQDLNPGYYKQPIYFRGTNHNWRIIINDSRTYYGSCYYLYSPDIVTKLDTKSPVYKKSSLQDFLIDVGMSGGDINGAEKCSRRYSSAPSSDFYELSLKDLKKYNIYKLVGLTQSGEKLKLKK